jgi:hypothetical protein
MQSNFERNSEKVVTAEISAKLESRQESTRPSDSGEMHGSIEVFRKVLVAKPAFSVPPD